MAVQSKAPIWFWVIGVVGLLWNGVGVSMYLQQVLMSAGQFAALPENQQIMLSRLPTWATAAFAIAVFAGFVASICWLLQKRVTVRLYIVSLLGVIVQFSSYFIVEGYQQYMSEQGWILPALILLFAIGLLLISWRAEQKGLLR
ncbi:hypothetical protein [Parasphingorhabdus sp.]|uniref:hypothetical protein n=1 Tax=Parasphingorhabdus sp. TaxID=2709688 RepID=UPI00359304A1